MANEQFLRELKMSYLIASGYAQLPDGFRKAEPQGRYLYFVPTNDLDHIEVRRNGEVIKRIAIDWPPELTEQQL